MTVAKFLLPFALITGLQKAPVQQRKPVKVIHMIVREDPITSTRTTNTFYFLTTLRSSLNTNLATESLVSSQTNRVSTTESLDFSEIDITSSASRVRLPQTTLETDRMPTTTQSSLVNTLISTILKSLQTNTVVSATSQLTRNYFLSETPKSSETFTLESPKESSDVSISSQSLWKTNVGLTTFASSPGNTAISALQSRIISTTTGPSMYSTVDLEPSTSIDDGTTVSTASIASLGKIFPSTIFVSTSNKATISTVFDSSSEITSGINGIAIPNYKTALTMPESTSSSTVSGNTVILTKSRTIAVSITQDSKKTSTILNSKSVSEISRGTDASAITENTSATLEKLVNSTSRLSTSNRSSNLEVLNSSPEISSGIIGNSTPDYKAASTTPKSINSSIASGNTAASTISGNNLSSITQASKEFSTVLNNQGASGTSGSIDASTSTATSNTALRNIDDLTTFVSTSNKATISTVLDSFSEISSGINAISIPNYKTALTMPESTSSSTVSGNTVILTKSRTIAVSTTQDSKKISTVLNSKSVSEISRSTDALAITENTSATLEKLVNST